MSSPLTESTATTPYSPPATATVLGVSSVSAAVGQPANDDGATVLRIEAGRGFRLGDLKVVWTYRELLYFLAWRDVAIRYKQTVLGLSWALLQPLATMLVFAVFLGRLGGFGERIPNYALFVLAGVLPWTFLSNAVLAAGNSVVANERLITKTYFPRLLVPLSAVGAPLFDFAVSGLLLAGMMVWYHVIPGSSIVLLPFLLMMLLAAACGLGCFLSALIVAQRDFRFILTFGVQLWMFATPSIYLSVDAFGPRAQHWLPLNPAYGLLLNFRHALLGWPIDWYALLVSSAVSVGLLAVGLVYFRHTERSFADVI
jgi:lipopolysaccharide transport system permease protein